MKIYKILESVNLSTYQHHRQKSVLGKSRSRLVVYNLGKEH